VMLLHRLKKIKIILISKLISTNLNLFKVIKPMLASAQRNFSLKTLRNKMMIILRLSKNLTLSPLQSLIKMKYILTI
ncbi:MAG: hypothetical protein ACK55Z_17615, partial [bacterium]